MHPGDDLETKSDKLDEIKDVSNIFNGTSNDSDSGFRSETPGSPQSSDSGKKTSSHYLYSISEIESTMQIKAFAWAY